MFFYDIITALGRQVAQPEAKEAPSRAACFVSGKASDDSREGAYIGYVTERGEEAGAARSERGKRMVDVEFNLMLIELAGKKTTQVEISGQMKLEEFIAHVGLKPDDVGMQLINKKWAPFDSMVGDGDYVQLFPWLEGG